MSPHCSYWRDWSRPTSIMFPAVTVPSTLQPLTRSPHGMILVRQTRRWQEWCAFHVGIGIPKAANSVTDAGLSCVSLLPPWTEPQISACRRARNQLIMRASERFTSSYLETLVWLPGTTSMQSFLQICGVPLRKTSPTRPRREKRPSEKIR